ncbi:hypothetical protein ACFVY1_37340 [Streptomyces sp. NPDC058293]|uniref:hypothetical protein n=1 Tax=Streptomyces sp. NPDC058293 TaxID=3346429 RepID=UPI0036E668B3
MTWPVLDLQLLLLLGGFRYSLMLPSVMPVRQCRCSVRLRHPARRGAGGAARGKAIIVLNPVEPPLIMRDTVHCVVSAGDEPAVTASVEETVGRFGAYVPGCRLKQKVPFDILCARATRCTASRPLRGAAAGHPLFAGATR